MDLLETWHKLEKEKLSKPIPGTVEIRKTSRHPVQRLQRAYLSTTIFAGVFLAGFIYLFFFFDERLVKIGLAFVIAAYIFFFLLNFDMYRKVGRLFPFDKSLKDVLAHTYKFITDNIRFQERAALFIYPIAGTAGFLMGGSLGSGDINSMIQKPMVLMLLLVVLIVLTPLCYYMTKWMYRKSYGKSLADLKILIDELEKPA